jgi:CRP-like cAMP-binding protein
MSEVVQKKTIELSKAQMNLLKVSNLLNIFEGLEKKEILRITAKVHFLNCQKGDIVFKKGDDGKDIFYILKGNIHLYAKESSTIESKDEFIITLGKGQALGEIGSITGEKRGATAIADDETLLLAFQIADDQNPKILPIFNKFYKNVIKILSDKLATSNKK